MASSRQNPSPRRKKRQPPPSLPGRRGYVYILANPSMPGLVKVGWSTDPGARAAQLSAGTAVPTPFRIVCVVKASDAPGLEAAIHRKLAPHRVARSREFFRLEPFDAARVLKDEARRQQVSRQWAGGWAFVWLASSFALRASFAMAIFYVLAA